MAVYTTVTTYASTCHQLFAPSIFEDTVNNNSEEFLQECFNRYCMAINKALVPYRATIMLNGEVVADVDAPKQLTQKIFERIIENINETIEHGDMAEKFGL